MIVHEIAHRGWAKNSPENTRAAFESVLHGEFSGLADGLECDVQMSKDGRVIVMHDIALGRVSYGDGSVGDLTYDELKCFDCGSSFAPRFAGESVMLFSALLKLVDGKSFLCVELKNPGNIYPNLADAVMKELERYPEDRFMVESFNHPLMKELKEKHPSVQTGLIFHDETDMLPEQCAHASCDWVSLIWTMADTQKLSRLRKQGIKPIFWTLNEDWQYARLQASLREDDGDVWIATDVPGASRKLQGGN
ncbi:MAG: hypothetical protein LBS00_09560 [Synergistaceae bacterium]|jgi:glycerophosphoryl diester phosphodiesterase|nr:hypothetical protein [Synergistaceae bacterium]